MALISHISCSHPLSYTYTYLTYFNEAINNMRCVLVVYSIAYYVHMHSLDSCVQSFHYIYHMHLYIIIIALGSSWLLAYFNQKATFLYFDNSYVYNMPHGRVQKLL